MIEPGDIDREPFTPGWIPDGWEKGEPMQLQTSFLINYIINKKGEMFHFNPWRIDAFYKWLEWWNDE